jgi:hypothetical protein
MVQKCTFQLYFALAESNGRQPRSDVGFESDDDDKDIVQMAYQLRREQGSLGGQS